MNISSIIEQGINFLQSQNLQLAKKSFKQVLKINPRHPDALHLLGIVENHQGNKKEAVRLIRKAIKSAPKIAGYHKNLGLILSEIGKNSESIMAFKRAVHLDNRDTSTHNDLGVSYSRVGKIDEAIIEYKKAIKNDPDNFHALTNLGCDLSKTGEHEKAISVLNKAVDMNHDYAKAHYNLGVVFKNIGQIEKAISSYRNAIKINAEYVDAYNNLGNIMRDEKKLDDAEFLYRKVIGMDRNNKEAFNGLGLVLKEQERFDEAVDAYREAIYIDSKYGEAHVGLGVALADKGEFNRAISSYRDAINIDNKDPLIHYNLSIALLLCGDFVEGWKEYEWGLLKDSARAHIYSGLPLWHGEDLDGEVILVTAEQGVGDEVMFSSCIANLFGENLERIVVECDSRLEELYSRSFPGVVVHGIERGARSEGWVDKFNVKYQIPVGSLPKHFRTKLSDFPSRKSFLVPDNDLCMMWRKRYNSLGNGIKIGISWTGGAKDTRKRANAPSLEQFIPLLSIDAYFINLQYGDHAEELAQFEKSTGIHIYDWNDVDPLTDLDNQAAQIAELDLVISFANATVHLAGALGKDVWTLVQWPPFWGWLLDRDDTVWYPSMRLFRKELNAGWDTVIDNVKTELEKRIGKE